MAAYNVVRVGDLGDVDAWYGVRDGMFEVLEDSGGVLVGCCAVLTAA